MPDSRFERAKSILAASPDRYFPGGEFRGADYWWSRRPDDHTPSCHMVDGGPAVKDFGDDGFRGSVLDAYAEREGVTVADAVARLVPDGADSAPSAVSPRRERTRKPKVEPVLPVPADRLKSLNAAAADAWYVERHGHPVKGWRYVDAEGRVLFCVVRYEREGHGKAILPWYYGTDGKWHNGQAYESDRPLYGLDRLAAQPDLPVLVVEGEKCGDVPVPGYVVVTWASGSSAVTKADWSPLAGRNVTIWPDADEPGAKAARAIKQRLPQAVVLTSPTDKPAGWDIADAAAEGIDLVDFINSHLPPPPAETSASGEPRPFICLGHDAAEHHFLLCPRRVPFEIPLGRFSASQLGELAPLAWWSQNNFVGDQGSIKVAPAQDHVIAESTAAGAFRLEVLRGVGVWLDRERIVINDGRQIVLGDGTRIPYDAFEGEAYYASSGRVEFGDMSGDGNSDEDGKALGRLFMLQAFRAPVQAASALGWALIAPFGGLLSWRPNIWITGPKGVGKSSLLKYVREVVGPFAHTGAGMDTQAGIRRTLNRDARPVVLDEAEARNKREKENISGLLSLVRNSAGDGSGYVTQARGDGVVQYLIRSCFCVAAVNVAEADAAQASRWVICEMQRSTAEGEREKIRRSAELYRALLGHDSGRFRRRIFRALPRVLADIAYLREGIASVVGDQRKGDVYAPLLAAAWAVQSSEPICSDAGMAWQAPLVAQLSEGDTGATLEDEDRVIEHIIGAQVRLDDNTTRTIAELLKRASTGQDDRAGDALSRLGLTFYRDHLAVATQSERLQTVLADTPYAMGYDAQLRRNKLCVNAGEGKIVPFLMGRRRARLLRWTEFRAAYLEGEE
ncbi:MAG TPA: hypothetical protein VFH17_08310 [Coriobacteriia bacterium]|nr:hypothetical protein [Coriobacteriia bacterium]